MKKNLRMILEIIIVPLAITYLLYLLMTNVDVMANVIFIVFTVITALEVMIKGIRYIYSYGPKVYKKILTGLLILSNVALLFSIYYVNYQTSNIYMDYLLYATLLILLIYLLARTIICIVNITKEKGKLYTNVTTSFTSFLSFSVIVTSIVLLYLKG